MPVRLFAVLTALALVSGSAFADVGDIDAPTAPPQKIDPLAGRAHVDLLSPFHADATAKPPVESAVVPAIGAPGAACNTDDDCAGRTWCDKNICVPITQRTWALFYFHEQGGDRGYRYVVPFYWHWWSAREEHRWLIPIFGEARVGDHRIGAAPLLLTGWRSNPATGDWRALVLGHAYFSHEHGKRIGVVFPLVWHFGSEDVATTVVLPFLVLASDRASKSHSVTFFPLFHYQRNEKEQQRLFLTFLGGYSQNDEQGVKQFIGLVPPLYHRTDRRRTVDFVFPIALRWTDREDHTSTTLIGPFVHHRDPEGTTDVFFPLFWRFHDHASDAATTILFPIAIVHTSKTTSAGIVAPGYYYRNGADWAGGLFPLLLFQNIAGRSHQMVLPLFAHARDKVAGTETTAVLNTYVRSTRDGWDGGFVPLLFGGRHGDVKYASVAGLYYYKGDRHGATHVLGPLYGSSTEKGYAFGLAPIINFSANTVEGTRTRWVLPPLFFHADDAKTQSGFTLIGPIFRATAGRETTQGIFPLAWGVDRGPRHWDVVLPLFAHFHDDEQKKDDLWIGPYVRIHDAKRDSTSHVFFPLFVKHDSPGYHVTVQFPFFWQVKEGNETDTVVFPFYGRVRRPGYSVDVAFPLVWRFVGKDSSNTVVGPFFYRTHDDRSDGGLVPLFGWGGTPGKRYGWALPLLFWHSEDQPAGKSLTILASFLWERHPNGWTNTFVPLWWAWKRGTVTKALAAPFIYHSDDSADGSAFNLIGPLYFGHGAHSHSGGLIPLVFATSHDDGRWSATVLPLFHVAQKVDGMRLITLLFGFSTYPTGNRGFVGPIYWRNELEGYTAAVIPIFIHSHDRIANSTTSLLLPLFFRTVNPERSLTAITPLVWRYQAIESGTTLGFPLFFDHNVYAEARTTMFLPFYIRNHRVDEKATSHIIPPLLLYVRKAPEGTDVVVFPIVWHFTGGGEVPAKTTAVFPLFWNFRRGTATTQVMFPLYARASRENADYTIVLNFYYRSGKGLNQGAYYFFVFPFFDYGRPHANDVEWNILGGLIGYSRIGKVRTLKLFWAGEVPLASGAVASSPAPLLTSSTSARTDLF